MKYIFVSLIGFFLLLESCNTVTTGVSEAVVRPPSLPSSVSFAGEKVPLDDQDVLERLDRELVVNQNYHSSTILIYKNVKRYKEPIERILKENGIPEDFFYLAVAESALNPNATSSANAVGIWQFIQATGEGYGLEVNNFVDERRHFVKSTRAACKYLLDAYKEFGNWTLVAAAYNRGLKGMKDAVTSQKTNNYYKLYLNQETARYVFRIIALKLILSNPQDFNFDLTESMQYPAYKLKSIKVTETIASLPEFAISNGTTYKELILHNPWIRTGKYNFDVATGKSYDFLIPDN
ncbi:MAG TPA: lytic transglycosylase domain-containing protein [Leptospiraceae bacterium]|nr:lytic transglycosylase domain-containing protein [Leptospiraceae bacterium]HMW05112.1 lytic transglycosylase domain-containing protein [Leptospiraceae bacterium]HMX31366.1 lytic transglycosylase domain-containing protein [Leptospiraceae bacterium]HMY31591.1 lytic transglycosylase domain-containing protein [Leptospiraceae bacterium]HMZ66858.1 lytic transglycosylase domain-containing protein [Leptospiraceae bacterium]